MPTILSSLSRRVDNRSVRRQVKRALTALRAERSACRAYAGGLPLELASRAKRLTAAVAAARKAARRAVLSRAGRRIDLAALLNLRSADGLPVWTVADPRCHGNEGKRDTDGTVVIGGTWRRIEGLPRTGQRAFAPAGLPPLPAVARKLLTDRNVRRRAAWIGVLYQPESWTEVDPDPAVVVEWKDLPGEYYALAVWGHDGPRIMEFVS